MCIRDSSTVLKPNDTPKAIKDSISEMPVTISAFSMGMFVIPIIIVLGTSLMD